MGLTAKQFAENLIRKWKGTLYIPTVEHQIYSTEETVIGSYMGKPLYRKVWELNLPRTDQTNIKILEGYFNDKKPIHIYGTIGGTDGKTLLPSNWINTTLSPAERFTILVYAGDVYLYANRLDSGNTIWSNQTITITAEYTKNADTTSSPKVPYEPLHEWSTEEKLVGYDEEGNAVYRQTVKTDVFSYTSNVVVQKTFPFAGKNVRSISGGFRTSPVGTSGHCFQTFIGSTGGNPSNNTVSEYYNCFVWANNLYFSYKRPDTSGGTAQGIAVIEYTKTTD